MSFFAARVTQHPHQRVIHLDESPIRRAKKQPLLDCRRARDNLQFPPVGNIFQHMHSRRSSSGNSAAVKSRSNTSAPSPSAHTLPSPRACPGKRQARHPPPALEASPMCRPINLMVSISNARPAIGSPAKLSLASWTTIKSVIASKSSIHCFFDRSIHENSRAFSSATEACPANASSKCRRPAKSPLPARHSTPIKSPLLPVLAPSPDVSLPATLPSSETPAVPNLVHSPAAQFTADRAPIAPAPRRSAAAPLRRHNFPFLSAHQSQRRRPRLKHLLRAQRQSPNKLRRPDRWPTSRVAAESCARSDQRPRSPSAAPNAAPPKPLPIVARARAGIGEFSLSHRWRSGACACLQMSKVIFRTYVLISF